MNERLMFDIESKQQERGEGKRYLCVDEKEDEMMPPGRLNAFSSNWLELERERKIGTRHDNGFNG
jgi:hypothetical protein